MRLITLFLLLGSLFFSSLANASDWYQVELFVFAQNHPQTASEQWDYQATPHYDRNAIVLSSSTPWLPDSASASQRTAADQGAWTLKPRDNDLPVAKMGSSMSYDGKYRPLFYGRWVQPLDANGTSLPIHIEGGKSLAYSVSGAATHELDGTIKLARSRYLHLSTNLWFASNSTTRNYFAHINESRRLKNGELHYLDNPLFGVIVRLTRIQ